MNRGALLVLDADVLAALADDVQPDLDAAGLTLNSSAPEGKYDTSPVGTPGGRQNWVDKAGGLPPFVRAVAHALIRAGRPKSTAIAIAIGQIKRWAAGGGDVSAKTRAKAVKTLAQWEKMKASSRTKTAASPAGDPTSQEQPVDTLVFFATDGTPRRIPQAKAAEIGAYTTRRERYYDNDGDHPIVDFGGEQQAKAEAASTGGPGFTVATSEAKVGDDGIEFKEAKVSVVDVVDEQRGIVDVLVSVTGIKDRVNDVIVPGAYEKSLAERTPKGVWSHSWEQPVSKTLQSQEVMPGDPMLKDLTLRDGSPWPAGAGALRVRTQFNLDGERGKQAYADVKFFADDQEWSIGYNVPKGGAEFKDGIRYIKRLDLYEYSPVLFGAMPSARTLAVKSLQDALDTDVDDVTEAWRGEVKIEDDEADGGRPDPKKPHEFEPDDDDKCKVCGLSIGGHKAAQQESATGEKAIEDYIESLDLPGTPEEKARVRDYVRDAIGRFSFTPGGERRGPGAGRSREDYTGSQMGQRIKPPLSQRQRANRDAARNDSAGPEGSSAAAFFDLVNDPETSDRDREILITMNEEPEKLTPKERARARELNALATRRYNAKQRAQREAAAPKSLALPTECGRCGSDDLDEYKDGGVECADCGHQIRAAGAAEVKDDQPVTARQVADIVRAVLAEVKVATVEPAEQVVEEPAGKPERKGLVALDAKALADYRAMRQGV